MPGLGLLLNPLAKRNIKDPKLGGRLARLLGEHGLALEASDEASLRHAIAQFRARSIDALVIAGGDGTNHIVVGALVEAFGQDSLPMIALLRGGTMNTVANSFGIPRQSPERLLKRYLKAYLQRHVQPMPTATTRVLRVGQHLGFIFGTGAIHGFIAEYNRREVRSPLWAAQVLTHSVLSAALGGETIQRVAARWHGQVRFDDGSAFPPRDYLAVGASTCSQIGLGFQPFFRSADAPEGFHILGIHGSAPEFIQRLPKVWQGKALGSAYAYEKVTDRAVLQPRHGYVHYTLDGDVYEHEGPLEVSIGPEITLLLPGDK